jgi:hypothetical protein
MHDLTASDYAAMADPVLRALAFYIDTLDQDVVVFRDGRTGDPITASEMAEMIRARDPRAVSYLDEVYGAAVRAVRVRAK